MGGNFNENLGKVFTFKDLKSFAEFWHTCYYDDSSNLIQSTLDDTEKRIWRNDKQMAIDCINLFRKDISPEWEDKQNAYGYELRFEIDVNSEKNSKADIADTYKTLWQDIVFALLAEQVTFSKEITGIRWKFQPNRNAVRLEVWIKSSEPKPAPNGKEKLLGNNIETVQDPKLKIYWGIRIWFEETIKNVRKN